jgi:3',5'-cyclic AMP phosphodiesterase CpdA
MIRMLHLSDPHFGAADPVAAEAFLARAWEIAPDLTLLSGDLTMRARRQEMAAARDFVDRLPEPRILIPGNHDIPGLNHLYDRFFRPFRRYQESFGEELEPEYRAGGLHVVTLNSTRPFGLHPDWSEGKLHKARLQRADRRFQGGPPALRVLMLHHPLSAPEGFRRAVVDPLPELLDLIGRCRVDLVLCGHFHRSHLALIGPGPAWQAVVSQAATVCSTRLQGEPPGFHEVRAEADRIEIVRSRFLSGRFAEESVHSFSRGACGWVASSAGAADPPPR